jgi:hypothetical protein
MTTTINIVSLNQGKNIYKDWTLETVDDTPAPANALILALRSALFAPISAARTGLAAQKMVPGE